MYRGQLCFAGVGGAVGGRQSTLSRGSASADAAACAERGGIELSGGWDGRGDSDRSRRKRFAGSEWFCTRSTARCGSAVGGDEGAASCQLCERVVGGSS